MTVDKLIEEALRRVVYLNNEIEGLGKANINSINTRLIYPKYREIVKKKSKEKKRISEQELKQVFIQVLNKENHEFLYSVETPTFKLYSFSGKKMQSAKVDICLHVVDKKDSKIKREFLLEFKAINKGPYRNDFNKLAHEVKTEGTKESIDTFFVHIVDSFRDATKGTIIRDYKSALEQFKKSKNNLTIYLLTLNNIHELNKTDNEKNRKSDKIEYSSINDKSGYYKIKINVDDNNSINRILDNFNKNNYQCIKNVVNEII